ncbi:hypothetical protein GCM10009798_37730 [Nocardioides panacihumi]|uniref:Uncharacterized protein n=1 Tax=Nocardioides panacihumi TaxID=400774 RepID=A0ABN2RQ88_9ACTN
MSEHDPIPHARRVADPNSPKYAVQHAGAPKRERRSAGGFGEDALDALGELLLGGVCVAVLAGLSAAVSVGWKHSPVLVAGMAVVLASFLAYGIVHIVRSARGGTPPRWPRLASAAAVSVVVAGLWALYVV